MFLELLYSINKCFRMIYWRVWQYSMSKIGYIFLNSKFFYHLSGLAFYLRNRGDVRNYVRPEMPDTAEQMLASFRETTKASSLLRRYVESML